MFKLSPARWISGTPRTKKVLLALVISITVMLGASAATALALATTSGGTSPKAASPATSSTSASDSALVASLAQVVEARTSVLPSEAQVFHTTLGAAADVVDADVAGRSVNDSVTVVLFSGNFTDYGARVPPGDTTPITGSVISFVVNSSGEATDYGIGPEPSDTTALGTGTDVSATSGG